jgi:hypothetical protein
MCGQEHWEQEGWRPFAAFSHDLTEPVEASSGDADAPLVREAELVPPKVSLP